MYMFPSILGLIAAADVGGDAFLSPQQAWAPATALESVAQRNLLDELEKQLGSSIRKLVEQQLPPIEESIKKSATAMPKNEYGKFGHSAVRYILHRYFVQRHGWYVTGLEPQGESWNSTSPVNVLKNRVSDRLQAIFERNLGGQGFQLRDMAILAAMVEALVRDEAIQRLRAVYEFHRVESAAIVASFQVDRLLDTYMQAWIMGVDMTISDSRSQMQPIIDDIRSYYPNWLDTERFLRKVRGNIRPGLNTFTFLDTVDVLMNVHDQYGHEQNKECQELKSHLLSLEESKGSGCVRLSDFYGSSLDGGKWQFSEKPDYLRQLGALEESDAHNPRVLVPNYLGGASNCLASSKYYSVCCLNECEGLMARVEEELAAPQATPHRIAAVVAAMPSASKPANRILSSPLLMQLDNIARQHGGQVPLYGRLFAQWMHHAYPRECPYPHMSGSTKPMSLDDLSLQGIDGVESDEDMKVYIQSAAASSSSENRSSVAKDGRTSSSAAAAGSCVPWHDEEELFVPWQFEPPVPLEHDPHVWQGFKFAAISSMIASASLVFLYSMRMMLQAVRLCRAVTAPIKPKCIWV
jgi:hypothetical protein